MQNFSTKPLDQLVQRPNISMAVVTLIARFEKTLVNALDEMGKTSGAEPFDLGGTAEEMVAVVEDLTWALLRRIYGDGTRLLHLFQTSAESM